MAKKKAINKVHKKGRPGNPIENGFQMNMAEQFDDRYANYLEEDSVEFAEETHHHKVDRNNKRKQVNSNQNKPNYIPRKKPKDYNQ